MKQKSIARIIAEIITVTLALFAVLIFFATFLMQT